MELVQKVMAAHQHGIDVVRTHGKLDLLKKGGTLRVAFDTVRRITAEDSAYQGYSRKEKVFCVMGAYEALGVDL